MLKNILGKNALAWGFPLCAYAACALLIYQVPILERFDFLTEIYQTIGFGWSDNAGHQFGLLLSLAIATCILIVVLSKIVDKGIGFDAHNRQTIRFSLWRAIGYVVLAIVASGLYGQKYSSQIIVDPVRFGIAAIAALIFAGVVFVVNDARIAVFKFFQGDKE